MTNLKENKLEIVSGSIFLFPSASKTLSHTAISASIRIESTTLGLSILGLPELGLAPPLLALISI